jgi:hypothetical protein
MAKRRSNHEGSIWQRQDGRWTGATYVLTTGGTFKRSYVYGRTREEVHDRLVKLQDLSARGIPQPSKAWRVGEYLDYWLTEVARPSVRPTMYAKYEVMVRLYLKPGRAGIGWTGSPSRLCRPISMACCKRGPRRRRSM